MPLDPNARIPNLRRRIYKEIEKSLLNKGDETTPGTFHLKHKGITLIAESVVKSGDGPEYTVNLGKHHGIVDGGHTYELIVKNLANEELPTDAHIGSFAAPDHCSVDLCLTAPVEVQG